MQSLRTACADEAQRRRKKQRKTGDKGGPVEKSGGNGDVDINDEEVKDEEDEEDEDADSCTAIGVNKRSYGKWRARLMYRGRPMELGSSYSSKELAMQAHDAVSFHLGLK